MAKILVVDDRPVDRQFLTTLLGYSGHHLLEAADGSDALGQVRAEHPDLVIADILMPSMDGYEFIRQIRADPDIAQTPVIFYTASYHEGQALALAQTGGVSHLLVKPADPELILSTIDTVLNLTPQLPSPPLTEEFDRDHLNLVTDKLFAKVAELESVNQHLAELIELGQQLTAERNLERLLQTFCEGSRTILAAQGSALGILDSDQLGWSAFLTSGLDTHTVSRLAALPLDQAVFGQLLATRQPLCIHQAGGGSEVPAGDHPPSATGDPALLDGLVNVDSFLGVPLASSTQLLGVLCLFNKSTGRPFTGRDERLAVLLGAQGTVAYENARLYNEIQRHAAQLEQEVIERRRAEEEVARLLVREQVARVQAEDAVRARDQFLSIASHELKTPLTSLIGYTDLLRRRSEREGLLQPREQRALEVISEQATRLNRLISTLLDVSRIQTGLFMIDRTPIDLHALVRRCTEHMQAALDQHTLEFAGLASDAPLVIEGDEMRLEQVLQNLLQNAVKYSPRGGAIQVRVEQCDSLACLSVTDHGIGIPPESLPHLFGRFYRAPNVSFHHISGLGVGLYIVKEIVTQHGGDIQVTSREGEGSTFMISLPLLKT